MNRSLIYLLLTVTIVLLVAILVKSDNEIVAPPTIIEKKEIVESPFIIAPPEVTVVDQQMSNPPYRQYKPKRFQQMGLLTNATETLPLYGRETPYYRDRYNYYTSTTGNQTYSLPVLVGDRDCTEDIGCYELYDNQTANVYSKPGTYNVSIYRVY